MGGADEASTGIADSNNLKGIGKPVPFFSAMDEGKAERLLESHLLEHKSAFIWNARLGRKDGDLRLGVLKTIAAFANSEGGELVIGVGDDGSVHGVDDEVARLFDDKHLDRYEALLHEHVRNSLHPYPHAGYAVSMEMRGKLTVCVVRVSAVPGVTYVVGKSPSGKSLHEVYVRTGNRTVRLEDRDRDRFVVSRFGGVWPL